MHGRSGLLVEKVISPQFQQRCVGMYDIPARYLRWTNYVQAHGEEVQ